MNDLVRVVLDGVSVAGLAGNRLSRCPLQVTVSMHLLLRLSGFAF